MRRRSLRPNRILDFSFVNSTSFTQRVSQIRAMTGKNREESLEKREKKTKRSLPDKEMEEFKEKEEMQNKKAKHGAENSVYSAPLPKRNKKGELVFQDFPDFRPNLTPEEVIRAGSFGGTYFRPIYSSVTKKSYTAEEALEDLPPEWFDGLDLEKMVTSQTYNPKVNKYKAKCGQGLIEWETSGWITEYDPYGWFQWYCRFFLGRRCPDDERQVKRGMGVMGKKGRWKRNLVNKCLQANKKSLESALKDYSISPTVRQLLLHWAYEITLEDLQDAVK